MKIHTVTICTGTLCHVMGGSELPTLMPFIPTVYQHQVVIKGSPCMGYCKESNLNPPFAEIDGEMFCEVTIELLVNELIKRIEHDCQQ